MWHSQKGKAVRGENRSMVGGVRGKGHCLQRCQPENFTKGIIKMFGNFITVVMTEPCASAKIHRIVHLNNHYAI